MLNKKFISDLKSINLNRSNTSYNFLDVIGKTDNENIISDWLAFLFNANKCSSCAPLKLFCEYLKVDYSDDFVKTEREFTLDNKRRIDIIIKMKNSWIIIENKINSMECNEQTVDYANKIENSVKGENINLSFVYLKPTYNRSNPKSQKFRQINYGELADIWKNITVNDFSQKENYIYFSEFIKLIKGKYAMNEELQFDSNTKFYIEYSEQLNAVEKSFNSDCLKVKEKLLALLNNVFPAEENWVISFHSEYIQFYKKNWGENIHYEIGTWAWQKSFKNISFNRLIAENVEITYCLHAERGQAAIYGNKFKEIETTNNRIFRVEQYNFDNAENCIASLNKIAERLLTIKNKFTEIIENLILTDKL